jgi:adenylate cyclase
LGGETREMTVLFSDVRDFTAISESMQDQPQRLSRLMNRLLTPLSTEILVNQGTIDKYMGDAIMAFWNAPLSDEVHALNACRAALGMRRAVDRLNDDLAREAEADDGRAIHLEVGMGSEQRFDYTVMGDIVNVASRAEGQCKTYGAQVIIGPTTAAEVQHEMSFVELDIIRVKGKREPQRIFALLGPGELAEAEDIRSTIARVNDLLTAYRGCYWDLALRIMEDLEKRQLPRLNMEVFLNLYRGRVEICRVDPPPANWGGVYVAEAK